MKERHFQFLILSPLKRTWGINMKKTLAMDLYKNKKVSLSYCAGVAEMTKEEFIYYLGVNGVSIFSFISENEFLEELVNA